MKRLAMAVVSLLLAVPPAESLVLYDEGRIEVLGIQLLRDSADRAVFYYLPDAPRLAQNADGTLALLCIQFASGGKGVDGGLFHALVEFTLPEEVKAKVEAELRRKVPGARLAGPVPLLPAKKEAEDQPGSFEVVSATMSDQGDKAMTRKVITSGVAPLTPGSRAAVAAMLNADGATLLWDSLQGPTSDVSVAINAYYEAMVTGFSGRITADVSTVYRHYSSIFNRQKEYRRRQIRDVSDELVRNGALKIESLDRGKALDLKDETGKRLLDLVTQKLVELMFDHKSGFSTDPDREPAVEQGQLLGRQDRSWLMRTFGGNDNTQYYTDDQWVIKERKDIKQNLFFVQITQDSTIKVPFSTAGNLHGVYGALKNDPRYFRIVDMKNPAFQERAVFFKVDGDFVDAFEDTVNFVAVSLRKRYHDPSRPASFADLRVDANTLKEGALIPPLSYKRLDEPDSEYANYDYRVAWSVRSGGTVTLPADNEWMSGSASSVALTPPFAKVSVGVDADRRLFQDKGVQVAVVEFQYPLLGTAITARKATLRAADTTSNNTIKLYRDRTGKKTLMRVTWYFKTGARVEEGWKELATLDPLFVLLPPDGPPRGGGQ